MSAFDLALETAAESGWALYELPHRHTLRTDGEAVRACAALAARLLERGAHTLSERSAEPLPVTPARIAIGTAHRDQALAVRRALAELGLFEVVADTANRLQGREFALRGLRATSGAGAESGRGVMIGTAVPFCSRQRA
jgi:hypothetical protein